MDMRFGYWFRNLNEQAEGLRCGGRSVAGMMMAEQGLTNILILNLFIYCLLSESFFV